MPIPDFDAILGKPWLDRHATRINGAGNTISWKPAGGDTWSSQIQAGMGPQRTSVPKLEKSSTATGSSGPTTATSTAAPVLNLEPLEFARTVCTDNYQDFFGILLTEVVPETLAASAATASSAEPDHQPAIDAVLDKHEAVFVQLPDGVPVRDVQHRITLEPGSKPVYQATRRMSPAELKEVSTQLGGYLDKGFIQPFQQPLRLTYPLRAQDLRRAAHVCGLHSAE